MSRSKFSKGFFHTLDAVLSAETGDLRELAAITGVDPEKLFEGANLAGCDLAAQDVSWLVPLDVQFENARLTEKQRMQLSGAKNARDNLATRMELREETVREFISVYSTGRDIIGEGEPLVADTLERVLLAPILNLGRSIEERKAQSAYMASVLLGLKKWAQADNRTFFTKIFKMFQDMELYPGQVMLPPLEDVYLPAFGSDVGSMIGVLESVEEIDRWFVMDAATSEQQLLFASRLTQFRPLHPKVTLDAAQSMVQFGDLISFLKRVKIAVDEDGAEKLAFMISRCRLTQDDMELVLKTNLPRVVARALQRQFMEHPDQTRLQRLIEWRDADRGAAGGLSLDTLFGAFKSFDLAVKSAEAIWGNLGPAQKAAILPILRRLMLSSRDRSRVETLERKI